MLALILLLCLILSSEASLIVETKQNRYEKEIRGSYKLNQTYELQFVIQNEFMHLKRIRGQDLVLYYQYSPNVYYLKVLDRGIIRYKDKEYNIPWDVPQENLLICLRKCIQTQIKQIESFSRFLRPKRSFKISHNLTWSEVVLLANMSEAMAKKMSSYTKSHNHLIQRFHLLVKGLVNVAGPPLWNSMPATTGDAMLFTVTQCKLVFPATDETLGTCSDMRHTTDEHCFGMCGIRCWCWYWICGDCCLHKGCLQHDKCCQKHGYSSIYCFLPWIFGFDCKNGYIGYPECLY